MKMIPFLLRSLTLAAGLCAASNIVSASSEANMSDSWRDVAVKDTTGGVTNYDAQTSGSFTVTLSLGGVVSSNFDSNTVVMLAVGKPGNTQGIFTNRLKDDPNFTARARSATFPILTNGMSNGAVTVSWTATTVNVAGSAMSDLLGVERMYTNTVNSNFFLGELTLMVDSTANPDGRGAVFTYDNAKVPVVGNNVTTHAAHTNADGTTTALQAGSISGAADFTPPKVAITKPAANGSMVSANSPFIDLAGTAGDPYGLASLHYSVNGGDLIPIDLTNSAAATVSWRVPDVDLSELGDLGTNTIQVYAVNNLGNSNSAVRTIILFETNSAVVTVSPTGSGTITGIRNKEVLQVGQSYPVTANAANAAWIFSRWTDASENQLSTNQSYVYTDSDGALTAVFVPNPFYDTALAGTYEALFYDTNYEVWVEPTNAGYITVTVLPSGIFSGQLYLGQSSSPFSITGQVTVSGGVAAAKSKVKVSGAEELDVQLIFAINPDLMAQGAGSLGGSVSESAGLWSEGIMGQLVQYNPDVVPGLYNVVISPDSDPAAGPGGYSFASATVSKTGGVVLSLTLADGTSPVTSFSTSLTGGGICPVFASLYGGKGVLIGALQFRADGTSTVTNYGAVHWVKLPVKDKFYTNGFDYTPAASGGLYESLNIFDWTAGNLVVDNSSAIGPFDVKYDPVKETLADPNRADEVSITLTSSTGALTGSSSAGAFRGVAVSVNAGGDAGWGFYPTANATAPIVVQAAPPEVGSFSLTSGVGMVIDFETPADYFDGEFDESMGGLSSFSLIQVVP
jgi:hypothetical protein